jgi:hypothetical protein
MRRDYFMEREISPELAAELEAARLAASELATVKAQARLRRDCQAMVGLPDIDDARAEITGTVRWVLSKFSTPRGGAHGGNAAAAVFGTSELFEAILKNLDMPELFKALRVNREWRDAIHGSVHLRRTLFLSSAPRKAYWQWSGGISGTSTTLKTSG